MNGTPQVGVRHGLKENAPVFRAKVTTRKKEGETPSDLIDWLVD